MNITVKRLHFSPTTTIGKIYIDGKEICDCLEDCDRGLSDNMPIDQINASKIFGQTAIPYGSYPMILNMSNRFKRVLPLILNVKGYEYVRIHGGNSAVDTLGCILLGTAVDANHIAKSQIALALFLSIVTPRFNAGEKISIIITK